MRPRIRTIKPEMWADERIGDLSHSARLLFIGLITMADDQGRLRELPSAILGHVFPYDDLSPAKLTRWLLDVEASGMIIRYEVAGKRYIAFRRWGRHQKVDKPNDSELPNPSSFDDRSPNSSTNDRGLVEDHSRPLRAGASGPVLSDPDPVVVRTEDARAIFDYWRERCGHEQAKPTSERLSKIRARLKDGYTSQQIRDGIDGAAKAAFVNDAGKRFDDIELICRNGSKLESFIGRADSNVVPMARPDALRRADGWMSAPEYQGGAS